MGKDRGEIGSLERRDNLEKHVADAQTPHTIKNEVSNEEDQPWRGLPSNEFLAQTGALGCTVKKTNITGKV